MRECDNPESFLVFDEDNRVGKSFNENLAGASRWGETCNRRGGKRRVEETPYGFINCDSKLVTKAGPLAFIPLFCLD